MKIVSKIHDYYRTQIQHTIIYCTNLEPHKTSFAIVAALCIGVVPLFGCTFILAISFGMFFRLNQFIIQSVHLLMSPFQILLFYPFVKAGQTIFQIDSGITVPFRQIPYFAMNHTTDFINRYLKIILAATGVWLFFSLLAGYILYRLVLLYFNNIKQKKVNVQTVIVRNSIL